MNFLAILYWLLIVALVIGLFAPMGAHWPRISGAVLIVLFVILGYHSIPLKL